MVRLGFARGGFKDPGYLLRTVTRQLASVERRMGIRDPEPPVDAADRLAELLEELHGEKQRRAVVLVDEYDKPILDALGDAATADANLDYLRGLYGAIKGCDAHIEKCFVTGVCRFPKTSLFSTANQFTDRTLDPRYDAVCGLTGDELDRVSRRRWKGWIETGCGDSATGTPGRGRERDGVQPL